MLYIVGYIIFHVGASPCVHGKMTFSDEAVRPSIVYDPVFYCSLILFKQGHALKAVCNARCMVAYIRKGQVNYARNLLPNCMMRRSANSSRYI
jgi:hypothetical protein